MKGKGKSKEKEKEKGKGKKGGGRPPSGPPVFRDGFYIEVRNRGTDPGSGVKLRKDTEAEMLAAAEEYRKIKLVIVLGEYKNGERVNATPFRPVKKKK
ncbi:MAG TPA: hypothetical protein VII99_00155 [Bacteroidia bacterium]